VRHSPRPTANREITSHTLQPQIEDEDDDEDENETASREPRTVNRDHDLRQ